MEAARFSPAVTFYLPLALLGLTLCLALREWRLYRAPDKSEQDPFPATRSRLVRRWLGSAILLTLSLTLASLGRWPPETALGAARYLNALTTELVLLFALLAADLWALGRWRRKR